MGATNLGAAALVGQERVADECEHSPESDQETENGEQAVGRGVVRGAGFESVDKVRDGGNVRRREGCEDQEDDDSHDYNREDAGEASHVDEAVFVVAEFLVKNLVGLRHEPL